MTNPVPGYTIATPYGRRGPYWSCHEDANGNGIHTGCDYPAPTGTPVVAARGGTLVWTSHGSAFGYHQVEILPGDGTRDFYAHLRSRRAEGLVKAGDKIGEVGSEGNATGPHLHFERHAVATGGWSCAIVRDPEPSIAYQPATGSGGGGSTGEEDNDVPDYASAKITKPVKLKADQWHTIAWDQPTAGRDYFDGVAIKCAGMRYSATLSVRVTDRAGGVVQTSWLERESGETVETNPTASHGAVDNCVDSRNGTVGKGRNLRTRVRVTGNDATLEGASVALLTFRPR